MIKWEKSPAIGPGVVALQSLGGIMKWVQRCSS